MTSTNFKGYDTMSKMTDKMTKFSDWLLKQMESRGWTQAELARRAKIHRQVVSGYINVKVSKPDEEILSKIALGLGLPDSAVFQAAGIMKNETPETKTIKEIKYLIEGLPEEDQTDVIEYIRHRLALAEKRGKHETNKKRFAATK